MPKDLELSWESPWKFKAAKYDNDVWVVKVASHKMAAASLTMDDGHIRVGHYVDIIRPQMDPLGEREELLILPGPEPIKQMNALMQSLGLINNINVPTATEFRKK